MLKASNSKIFIIPLKYHLRFFFLNLKDSIEISTVADTVLMEYVNESKPLGNVKEKKMHSFGLHTLKSLMGLGAQVPIYIPGLQKILNKYRPSKLVCFDFYHFYFLQCLRYVKRNKDSKIILYSETRRWPNNQSSSFFMLLFLSYVKRNRSQIQKVLVYSKEGKEWWEREVPELPVEILAAPIDIERFSPTTSREWVPNQRLRILMNARYSEYKRHNDLFAAARQLLDEGKKLHITLIGRADSGRDRINELVKDTGLKKDVTFLDSKPIDKMPKLYHQHDVLVLPSYNEAIGMVVPEAMACGLPTITSDTVGANVYVKDGETGWVHPTGDVPALTAALRECFNPAELERRGNAARKQVEENFSVPAITERFLQLVDAPS